ncbi:MAG: hypothetical protein JST80_04545 [Bdellovibrionales bacterium]|nr:hypothetical protein [Bdellovibrionales bacterium]
MKFLTLALTLMIATPVFAANYVCYKRTGKGSSSSVIAAYFVTNGDAIKVCAGTQTLTFTADQFTPVKALQTGYWSTWKQTRQDGSAIQFSVDGAFNRAYIGVIAKDGASGSQAMFCAEATQDIPCKQ